jgi:hypothetical protein
VAFSLGMASVDARRFKPAHLSWRLERQACPIRTLKRESHQKICLNADKFAAAQFPLF